MRDVQGSVYADLIGKPFLWRGRGEGGLDCFGLVLEMFKRTGQVLPQLNTPSNLAAVSAMAAVQFANPDWQPCERAADWERRIAGFYTFRQEK